MEKEFSKSTQRMKQAVDDGDQEAVPGDLEPCYEASKFHQNQIQEEKYFSY